jgi:hypothetical protein
MTTTTYVWIGCMLLMACYILLRRRNKTREGFMSAAEYSQETIFVSVASYRDTQCVATIQDIFKKAKYPERITVGLVQQNSAQHPNEECLLPDFRWRQQVRVTSIPYTQAKGPTWARYLATTMYRDESYYCQIDSHTTFVQDWDDKAISILKRCPSSLPILTHYPHATENMKSQAHTVPVLCKSTFSKDTQLPTLEAIIKPKTSTPTPVPFMSGGFVFAPGRLLKDVPFDPDLPMLFQGEEILYAARAWTSNYDFFTPTENIVYHVYYRTDAPKFWNDIPQYKAVQLKTQQKVRKLLGIEKVGRDDALHKYPYGLGTKRSLQEYYAFAGLNPVSLTSSSEAKFCS